MQGILIYCNGDECEAAIVMVLGQLCHLGVCLFCFVSPSHLLHLRPDEEVQLPAETQHLQADLLRTEVDGHQRSLHL